MDVPPNGRFCLSTLDDGILMNSWTAPQDSLFTKWWILFVQSGNMCLNFLSNNLIISDHFLPQVMLTRRNTRPVGPAVGKDASENKGPWVVSGSKENHVRKVGDPVLQFSYQNWPFGWLPWGCRSPENIDLALECCLCGSLGALHVGTSTGLGGLRYTHRTCCRYIYI